MEVVVQQYRYLMFFAMLYLTLKLSTIFFIYKIIYIGNISFTASTIIIPFWFFLGTILAETYGYTIYKNLLWTAIFCQLLFASLCFILTKLPSPIWINQSSYNEVLGTLPRVTISSTFAILGGGFTNAYLLAKFKILSRGKHFWLRGLKSSIAGELVFTVLAYLSEFIGVVPASKIFQLMIVSFVVKVALSPILILPAVYLATKLKKSEKTDTFDYSTNFNPFKFRLKNEQRQHAEPKNSNVIYLNKFSTP